MEENELLFSDLKEEDSADVVQFMANHFYPREPLSTGLHMTYEDNKEWIYSQVLDWVRSGASIVVRCTNTNEIVGSLLATILTKKQNTSFDEALSSPRLKVKTLHKVLSVLEASVNLFEKYDVDKILELAMITVREDFGGRGIGKKLVQEGEKKGVKLGCELAAAQATALSSQRLFERLDYATLFELNYKDFSINGENVFDIDRMMGTQSAKVMAKMLVSRPFPPNKILKSFERGKRSLSPAKVHIHHAINLKKIDGIKHFK